MLLSSAAFAAEQFFRNLDGGTTVEDASREVTATKAVLGMVSGGLGTFEDVALQVSRRDDAVIIDNTPSP
ncbi:MAG: hypothetical protein M3436_20820 [Pseudomonadota bacterium]|nr:hypothetical protein [Pseudomonadota bacterium]